MVKICSKLHSHRRNRYYNPGAGRFMSEDPIGFEASDINLYRYVGNNVLIHTDPLGLYRWPGDIFDEAINHNLSSSGTDDIGNAFQHCFASCMMSAENGELFSEVLGNMFEGWNNYNGQNECQEEMDLNNNSIGREFGSKLKNKSSKEISKSCANSCMKSSLITIKSGGWNVESIK